jgi:Protein of unknown function (DUF3987)
MNSSSTSHVITFEAARAEAEPWPTPRPLACPPPPTLDLEKAIPPGLAPFREFCAAVAEALQVPPDAVPPLVLALASIGTARALEVELSPQWRETVNLWVCVLMDSAQKKSTILKLLKRPLEEWEKSKRVYLAHALADYDEKRNGLTSQLAGKRDKQKSVTGHDLTKQRDEAREIRAKLDRMPPLYAPNLIADDFTPEALRNDLEINGEKVAFVTAESDADQLLGKRYGSGAPNLNLILKSKGGDSATTSRASGLRCHLEGPLTCAALVVQMTAVEEVLRDPYAKGRGLLPRYWFLALAHPTGFEENVKPAQVPPHLLEWWDTHFRRLLDLPWPGSVILTADGPARCEQGPRVLRLTPEADELFTNFRGEVNRRKKEDGDLYVIREFAAKFAGEVARIAAILHALQADKGELIPAETMRAACAWAPFLLEHYKNALGEAAESDDMKLARRVLGWFKRKEKTEATATEIQRALDNGGKFKKDDFTPALDLLEESDWLRKLPDPPKNPGRPLSPGYAVNPAALA